MPEARVSTRCIRLRTVNTVRRVEQGNAPVLSSRAHSPTAKGLSHLEKYSKKRYNIPPWFYVL